MLFTSSTKGWAPAPTSDRMHTTALLLAWKRVKITSVQIHISGLPETWMTIDELQGAISCFLSGGTAATLFPSAWGWGNNEWIFIFGWTVHSNSTKILSRDISNDHFKNILVLVFSFQTLGICFPFYRRLPENMGRLERDGKWSEWRWAGGRRRGRRLRAHRGGGRVCGDSVRVCVCMCVCVSWRWKPDRTKTRKEGSCATSP